jgi:hypothetical protein
MLLNADAGRDFAASWTVRLPIRICRFGGLVHAAGLDVGWPLQALQPRDLFPLFANNLLQSCDFAKHLDQQRFKLWPA